MSSSKDSQKFRTMVVDLSGMLIGIEVVAYGQRTSWFIPINRQDCSQWHFWCCSAGCCFSDLSLFGVTRHHDWTLMQVLMKSRGLKGGFQHRFIGLDWDI